MRCGDSCPEGRKGTHPRAVRGGDRTGWQDASPPGFSPLALDAVCETPSRCSVQTLCWGGAQPRGVACCTPVAEVARAVGWVSGVPANRAARSMASRPRGARPFTERGHHRRAGGPPFKTRGPCGIFGDTRRDSAGGRRGGAPSLWSGRRPKGHCSDVWRSSTGASATQRTGERRADALHGNRGLSAVHPHPSATTSARGRVAEKGGARAVACHQILLNLSRSSR